VYKVNYHCTNCGRFFSREFARGDPAPFQCRCEHCGVYTARKEHAHGGLYYPDPSRPDPWSA
jgi:DNA-directed RNA polymerase subunit RPC12/RpoP